MHTLRDGCHGSIELNVARERPVAHQMRPLADSGY